MAADVQTVEKQLLQVASLVEQHLDDEIEKLDKMDEDDLEILRQKRLQAMKKQQQQKQEWLTKGHGEYSVISTEKEFFETCKKSVNVVCHFYRSTTFRCEIVDKHLSSLAKKHLETKFCKINAEKSPYLTSKLKIRVLPTILLCKEGKTRDFIVGFDDLGGIDEFSTEMLEWRIAQADVIEYQGDLHVPPGNKTESKMKNPLFGYRRKNIRGVDCDDSDDDD